ncbi:hypothetical protein GCM10022419_066830 [Nonomuraea rosea]|uniref:CU044_5270 family protein n=1 Tax=Nonomuraea rosea TaxID=638574 RepID=A0ABP6Y7Y9_9ACTN
MDELDLLARALPDARPPSPEVVARARARVATGPHAGVRARPAWRRFRAMWAPLATAAVVALVAVLVSNLAAPAPAPVLQQRNQELLDLADRVGRLPAEGGAYWRQVTVSGRYMKSGGYTLLATGRREVWLPRDPARTVLTVSWPRSIARPATAADMRAWQAAGSPAKVENECPPAKRCGSVPVTTELGSCRYDLTAEPSGSYPDRSVASFTMADLAALPTDEAALREKLRGYHKVWYDRGFTQTFEQFLPVAANLLSMPLTPAQRAALLRLLAGSPATEVVGPVIDPLGRKGLSVNLGLVDGTLSSGGKPGTDLPVYYRLILDPATGATLARVSYAARAGLGRTAHEAVTFQARAAGSGWTSEPPAAPRGCKASR